MRGLKYLWTKVCERVRVLLASLETDPPETPSLLPPIQEDPNPKILFVCTGNFYRSRFAEAVFNARAQARGLPWRAFSAGLAVETSPKGLSVHALNGLRLMNIPAGFTEPRKRPFSLDILAQADRCIAMQQTEHQPMIESTFPEISSRIQYWEVPDLPYLSPPLALTKIREGVDALIKELVENSEMGDSKTPDPQAKPEQ